jgi:SAM-dependent methyltransferase
MNAIHNRLCASGWWAKRVDRKLVPWGTDGVDLRGDVLEVGPGFGATTRRLTNVTNGLTVVELDPRYCARLRSELGDRVSVVRGDATDLPFEDGRFSTVLCFTMLHHIPVRAAQDRAFGEVARVLRPGGTFAGTDSIGTGRVFKLIHLGDTLLKIDPDELPGRLTNAGLSDPQVERGARSFRFRATKSVA